MQHFYFYTFYFVIFILFFIFLGWIGPSQPGPATNPSQWPGLGKVHVNLFTRAWHCAKVIKITSAQCVCFPESGFRKTTFQTFLCLFTIRKVDQQKIFFSQMKNFAWFSEKCFPFILGGKHFPEVVKNLEMLCYLLIISNLVLKLLIVIYILF
jgi:hypothetical protein